MIKDKIRPHGIFDGEQIILEAQGAYKYESRSGWKPGRLFLTDRRVGFQLPSGRTFSGLDLPLADIRSVTVEKRPFVLSSRQVLLLTFLHPSKNAAKERSAKECHTASRVWLITRRINIWHMMLHSMIYRELDEETIARLGEELDPEAGTILWHIWYNGHAGIQELAELIQAECHTDVLVKIRTVINPLAEKLLGFPVLIFMSQCVKSCSGETVPYSWWIAGRREGEDLMGIRSRCSRIDIFKNSDHVDVIADLPGIREEDILLTVAGERKLVISAASDSGKYREEVILPAGIELGSANHRLNNGVLHIRLRCSGGSF